MRPSLAGAVSHLEQQQEMSRTQPRPQAIPVARSGDTWRLTVDQYLLGMKEIKKIV